MLRVHGCLIVRELCSSIWICFKQELKNVDIAVQRAIAEEREMSKTLDVLEENFIETLKVM